MAYPISYFGDSPVMDWLGTAEIGNSRISVSILWLLGIANILAAVLRLTAVGNWIFASRGDGRAARVMAEAESAAIEVEDPALFSDPYSTWCYERGAKRTATEYIHATEEMFRRSRDVILESMKKRLRGGSDHPDHGDRPPRSGAPSPPFRIPAEDDRGSPAEAPRLLPGPCDPQKRQRRLTLLSRDPQPSRLRRSRGFPTTCAPIR